MQLTWAIEGQDQLVRKLEHIGKEVKDWTPAFKEASEKLKGVFENDVFRTQGAKINERWQPLKPSYLARKVKQGYPADPLIKTGLMKSSFYASYSKDQGEIGNSAEYFKYHQSKLPRTKIPRRIMMKLGNPQKEIVVKIFHTYWFKKVHAK